MLDCNSIDSAELCVQYKSGSHASADVGQPTDSFADCLFFCF